MEQKEEKQRERKQDIKRGVRTQKMMTFRCDNDVAEILSCVANKGRLLNDLVKEWAKSRNRVETDDPPDSYRIPLNDEM